MSSPLASPGGGGTKRRRRRRKEEEEEEEEERRGGGGKRRRRRRNEEEEEERGGLEEEGKKWRECIDFSVLLSLCLPFKRAQIQRGIAHSGSGKAFFSPAAPETEKQGEKGH